MPQKSQGFCVQGKSTQRALSIISCHGVQNLFRGIRGCNKIGFIGFTGGMHIETAVVFSPDDNTYGKSSCPQKSVCVATLQAGGRSWQDNDDPNVNKEELWPSLTIPLGSDRLNESRSPSTSKTFPIGVRGVTYRLLFARCNLDFNLSSRSSIPGSKASSKVYLIREARGVVNLAFFEGKLSIASTRKDKEKDKQCYEIDLTQGERQVMSQQKRLTLLVFPMKQTPNQWGLHQANHSLSIPQYFRPQIKHTEGSRTYRKQRGNREECMDLPPRHWWNRCERQIQIFCKKHFTFSIKIPSIYSFLHFHLHRPTTLSRNRLEKLKNMCLS